MARYSTPVYETQAHRDREARIAREFATERGWFELGFADAKGRLPLFDRVFVSAHRISEVCAFGSIKTSEQSIDNKAYFSGGGYKDRTKDYEGAQQLYEIFQLPVLLIVEFTDALAWLDMTKVRPWRDQKLRVPLRGVEYEAVLYEWPDFHIERRPSLHIVG